MNQEPAFHAVTERKSKVLEKTKQNKNSCIHSNTTLPPPPTHTHTILMRINSFA